MKPSSSAAAMILLSGLNATEATPAPRPVSPMDGRWPPASMTAATTTMTTATTAKIRQRRPIRAARPPGREGSKWISVAADGSMGGIITPFNRS
jgi:hypothetical protein